MGIFMKRKKAGVVILCAAVLIAGIFAAAAARDPAAGRCGTGSSETPGKGKQPVSG